VIGRKALLSFVNLAVGALLGLAALKFTALYFGIEAYGQVAYAMSVLGIVYLFTDVNIAEAHIKRVSEGWDIHDCFKTFAMFKVFSTTVFVSIVLAFLYVYAVALGKPLESTTFGVLFAVLAYYCAKNAMITAQSTFEAKIETARAQAGNLVETVVRVALTFVGVGVFAGVLLTHVAWLRENPGTVLAVTYLGGALAGAVFSVALMWRLAKGRGAFRWEIMRSYWAFSIPLFLVSAMTVLATYIDRAALGFFGAANDAADLAAPRQLVGVIEGLSVAAGALLFPIVSQLAAKGDRAAVNDAVDRAVRYLSLTLLPLVVFLIAFPERIILLTLSDAWQGTGLVLILLSLWMFLAILTRPLQLLLFGLNETKVAARIGVTGAVLNTILVIALVPDDIKLLGLKLFGLKAVGAAIALLISGAVVYVMFLVAAWRVAGYRQRLHLWKHVAAGLVMIGALRALDAYGPVPVAHWWSFPLYGILGVAVYGACLVGLRELTAEDFRYAKETLNPGEMLRYVRGELFDREG
jgi:O-antigen/teichoic acid export membrane protein